MTDYQFHIGDQVTWTATRSGRLKTHSGRIKSINGRADALIESPDYKKRIRVELARLTAGQADAPADEREPDTAQVEPVFPENSEPGDGRARLVPLEMIDPNPYQPRQAADAEGLARLARGLHLKRRTLPDTCGLLQLPLGRELVGRVQLAFGHRRLEAFRLNQEKYGDDWQVMPVRLMALSDEEMYDFAARENSDRADLNAIDKARSIRLAQEELDWSLGRAANAHGLSKSAGSNLVRLLQLPETVQQQIVSGELSQRHGRELLRLVQAEPPLRQECLTAARLAVKFGSSVKNLAGDVDIYLRNQALEQRRAAAAEARAAHRESRYCRRCDGEREFSGPEIDRDKAVDCAACGYNGRPGRWRLVPLPDLPAETVRPSPTVQMRGWWYCGFCNEHQPPGLAARFTIGDEPDPLKVCRRCEERLRPLAAGPAQSARRRLLIVACSERKRINVRPLPARLRYDGPLFRMIRKLEDGGRWPADLDWRIISAKHGLLQPDDEIEHYDRQMDDERAQALGPEVRTKLGSLAGYAEIFVNLGASYLPALPELPAETAVRYAKGGIGSRVAQTRAWILGRAVAEPEAAEAEPQARPPGDRPATRTCPHCDGQVRNADDGGLVCDACGEEWLNRRTFQAAQADRRWLDQRRAEAGPEHAAAAAPTLEPRPQAGRFDCPRCSRERIVKTNGGAWCLDCGAKWPSSAEFHEERAQGAPAGRTALESRLLDRVRTLIGLATLEQLAALEAWLDDNDIFSEEVEGAG